MTYLMINPSLYPSVAANALWAIAEQLCPACQMYTSDRNTLRVRHECGSHFRRTRDE
jgi:hypothetical protein